MVHRLRLRLRSRGFLAATLVVVLVLVLVTWTRAARAQLAQPAPANASLPRQVTDLRSAASQTAAVLEATVLEIRDEFSDAEGPWTRLVLSELKVHLGTAPAKLELLQFGGPLPSGRLMVAAELPVFVKGARYLLFLRNTSWNLSPIVGGLAFRIETLDGAEVLVSSDGHPVMGVDAGGPVLGAALFEPTPYGGAPAAPKAGALATLGRKPLDRRGFLAALKAELDAQGQKVGGPFYARPGGAFHWRGQPVAASGPRPSTVGAGRAERDTSGNPSANPSANPSGNH